MTRNKGITMAAVLGFCAIFSAQINAAMPTSIHTDSLPMAEINAPIKNAAQPQLSYIEELASESLHARSIKVNAEANMFAGPYNMFVTEPSSPLSDYSASGMILASIGLMALIVRRRINM